MEHQKKLFFKDVKVALIEQCCVTDMLVLFLVALEGVKDLIITDQTKYTTKVTNIK